MPGSFGKCALRQRPVASRVQTNDSLSGVDCIAVGAAADRDHDVAVDRDVEEHLLALGREPRRGHLPHSPSRCSQTAASANPSSVFARPTAIVVSPTGTALDTHRSPPSSNVDGWMRLQAAPSADVHIALRSAGAPLARPNAMNVPSAAATVPVMDVASGSGTSAAAHVSPASVETHAAGLPDAYPTATTRSPTDARSQMRSSPVPSPSGS